MRRETQKPIKIVLDTHDHLNLFSLTAEGNKLEVCVMMLVIDSLFELECLQ